MKTITKITWRGETRTIAEWSAVTEIPSEAIRWRLNNKWDIEKALTKKPRTKHQRAAMPCGAKSMRDCFNCQLADCIAPPSRRLEGE